MNGVKFEDKHSITDWHLLMTSRKIEDAQPKTNYLDVPGSDGSKDLTEAFGNVKYYSRKMVITFDILGNTSEIFELKDEITNYLNGKKVKIIYDTDPNYYYYGRCRISDFSIINPCINSLTVEAECDPYKYKIQKTIYEITVEAGETYTFLNDKKNVIPKLTLSDNMILEFCGNSYALSSGTHKILDIEFVKGINEIKILEGDGILKVEYQEAKL